MMWVPAVVPVSISLGIRSNVWLPMNVLRITQPGDNFMKTFKSILLAAAAFFPICSASARPVTVEVLTNQITLATAISLSELACRNMDKIVHLDLSIDWPSDKISPNGNGVRLVFSNDHTEFLFPKGSFTYLYGVYIVKGYFIARSGGTHKGVSSDAFEKINDAAVMLNPNVKEVPARSGCGPESAAGSTPSLQVGSMPGTTLGSLRLFGNRSYTGEILHGKPYGKGAMTSQDGQRYVGDFVDGNRQGQGTVTFADGRTFIGEYQMDERNGLGSLILPTGESYVGEYRGGEKDGQGTSYLANGNIEYSGLWIYGKFLGAATTPEAFINIIYEWYRHGSTGTGEKSLFVPPMIALMNQSHEIAQRRNEWGPSDGSDYLCQCGDASSVTSGNLQISVNRTQSDRAVATVGMELSPTSRTITLQLVLMDGLWRIEDMSSNAAPATLKLRLQTYIAQNR